MKFTKKGIVLVFAAVFSASAFAQTEVTISSLLPGINKDISDGLNTFSKEILVAAPEASTQQNVWADAYIGQLLAFPPHLGGGISLGGTLINMTGLQQSAEALKKNFNVDFGNIPDKFLLPIVSADVRLGGLILPFDIGLSAMMTNPSLFDVDFSNPESILEISEPAKFTLFGFDGTVDYLTLGIDLRFCLFQESFILPNISLGAGYTYTKGFFGINATEGNKEANLAISYNTHVVFFQAEASKDILFMTVFGGARALVSNTATSWAWDIKGTYSFEGTDVTLKDSDSGAYTTSGATDTYNKAKEDRKFAFENVQPQLYAGVGFNFLVCQASLSLCADIRSIFDQGKSISNYESFLWSGAFSLHVKF